MDNKYKPSGIAPISSIAKTTLIGVLFAIILPLIYIIINRLIPNIWFAAISAVLFGISLGAAINWSIKIGKIRNVKIAIVIASFCGLLAIYTQWVIFDELMYNDGFTFNLSKEDLKLILKNIFFLFTHPSSLWQEIVNLNDVGTFTIDKSNIPFTGTILWIVWICETLIVLISTILYVKMGKVSEPYSELEDCWMKKRQVKILPTITDKDEILKDFDRGNFHYLEEEPTGEESLDAFAELIVYESDRDPIKFISINNVNIKRKKKGKEEITRKTIIKYFPINSSTFRI